MEETKIQLHMDQTEVGLSGEVHTLRFSPNMTLTGDADN